MRENAWWRRLGRLVKRKAVEWWEPEPFLVDLWDSFRVAWRPIVSMWAIYVLLEWTLRDESIAAAVGGSIWLVLVIALVLIAGRRDASEGEDDDQAASGSPAKLPVRVLDIAAMGLAMAYIVDRYGGSPALEAVSAAAMVTLGAVMEFKVRAKARREPTES